MFKWFKRKDKKLLYFVVFYGRSKNNTKSMSNIFVTVDKGGISNANDIRGIEDFIKERDLVEDVVILNIIRIK